MDYSKESWSTAEGDAYRTGVAEELEACIRLVKRFTEDPMLNNNQIQALCMVLDAFKIRQDGYGKP